METKQSFTELTEYEARIVHLALLISLRDGIIDDSNTKLKTEIKDFCNKIENLFLNQTF